MISVAISGGYLANNLAKEESTPVSAPSPGGSAMVGTAETDAVSSPSEPLRRDSGVISSANARESVPPPSATAGKTQAKPAPAKPAPAKPSLAKQAPATGARDLAARTADQDGKAKAEGAVANRDSAGDSDSTDAAEEIATKAAEQDAIRIQAAEALSQLDRERRLNRAAAATAALDRQAAARRETPAPAAAAPPPTLEQRAQVYLRIGLDEANRQLGGPVHVIEGMSPVFMGLAPGRVAAGADTTRPVVRVVYQDSQGRIIVLDQQRTRPGQAAAPGARGAWSLGDLTMGLQGEVPPEVLRTLRSRVR